MICESTCSLLDNLLSSDRIILQKSRFRDELSSPFKQSVLIQILKEKDNDEHYHVMAEQIMINSNFQSRPPVHIGDYMILQLLGQGGMGTVYRARHYKNGPDVALKTIKVLSAGELDSIRREIHTLAKMSHSGIVHILDHGERDGVPWYAMELLQGLTLREFGQRKLQWEARLREDNDLSSTIKVGSEPAKAVADTQFSSTQPEGNRESCPGIETDQHDIKSGSWELNELLQLVAKICEPLFYLHCEGLVHRDLKPENIILTTGNQPVLFDFGLITQFSGDESRDILEVGGIGAGTAHYISPEQIRGELVDARADLYALGCLLYELLTGHPPFIAFRISQVLQAHLHASPTRPSHFNSTITPELDDLVLRLLAKKPQERVGFADIVAMELHRITGELKPFSMSGKKNSFLYRSRLTGRQSILQKLRQSTDFLEHGSGGLIFLSGESGVGKTRLIMEFGRELIWKNILVLTGDCSETSRRPLEALLKPLQRIADRCREQGPEETAFLVAHRGKVFSPYVPSYAGLQGMENYTDPGFLPPDAATIRLYTYLIETLSLLSQREPVVIILDDLQWADDLSLTFIEFLLRSKQLEKFPIFVVGTFRSDLMNKDLETLGQAEAVQTITLERLSQDSITSLVGDMLALSGPPKLFSTFLYERAEGNPLFVAEYLRAAVEEGLLYRNSKGEWEVQTETSDEPDELTNYQRIPLPRSVSDIITRRLAGLSDLSRSLIEYATLIGRKVDSELLKRVLATNEESFIDATEELLKRLILEKTEQNTFHFVHNQLRKTALSKIPPRKKKKLCFSIAAEMETLYEDNVANHTADLGRLWEAAGEKEKAQKYYLAAAKSAQQQNAFDEAERHYRAFLNLTTGPSHRRCTAQYDLGDVLELTGKWNEALEIFERALRFAEERKSKDLQAHGLVRLGTMYTNRSRFKKAISCFKRAITIFKETKNPHQECGALKGLGNIFFIRGDYEQALATYKQSLALAEKIDDQLAIAYAVGNMGNIYLNTGDYERSLQCCTRNLVIAESLNDKRSASIACGNIGTVYYSLGNHEKSLEYIERQVHMSEMIGYQQGISLGVGNLGVIYVKLGLFEKAMECYNRQIAIATSLNHQNNLFLAHGNIGDLYAKMGKFKKAQAHQDKKMEIVTALGDKLSESYTCRSLGYLFHLQRDYKQALAYYQRALSISEEINDNNGLLDIFFKQAETLYSCQQFPEALAAIKCSLEKAHELGQSHDEVTILQAKINHALGQSTSIQTLKTMLTNQTDETLKAEIYYTLWFLTSEHNYGRTALRLYQESFQKIASITSKRRIAELEKYRGSDSRKRAL